MFDIGQTASLTRAFSAAEVAGYRALTGDRGLRYGGAPDAVPGPLLGALISNLLGTVLPGRGTMWLKQAYTFPAPAWPERPLVATVTIERIRPEKSLVNLRTTCTDDAGRVVCTGEALVWVKNLVSPEQVHTNSEESYEV